MSKLEFNDEFSRLMEEFNISEGAVLRRARILSALDLNDAMEVLDVGSGPGHQIEEIARAVGPDGSAIGVDSAEGSVELARQRCAGLSNAQFSLGNAYDLPFENRSFDRAMSSQVFEYLDDLPKALSEMFRVLRPGGQVLIHGTAWGALLWHSEDPARMEKVLKAWDGHLADPKMPETMARKLHDAGFKEIEAEPLVHVEIDYNPSSMSAILVKFITGYVVSQGIPESEVNAWAAELTKLGAGKDYFFSSNEYIFTARRP